MRKIIVIILWGGIVWGQPSQPGGNTTVRPQCSATRTTNCTPLVNSSGVFVPTAGAAAAGATGDVQMKAAGGGLTAAPMKCTGTTCSMGPTLPTAYTIGGTLPAAAAGNLGQVRTVSNGASLSDCTVGGGTAVHECYSTGSAWTAYAGGNPADATNTVKGIVTLSTATSNVAVATDDTRNSNDRLPSAGTVLVAQKFFGTSAPGSVATNLPGDFFTDTTAHNQYVCNAPSGTAAPACTSVTAAGWLLVNIPATANPVTASANITDLYSVIGDGGAKGVKVGPAIATAATASTIAERNASGEVIATNTVATGKTPLATDGSAASLTGLTAGQIPPVALPTPGATCSMVGNATFCVCTTTCTITPLAPVPGSQLCARNDTGVSTVITLAGISSIFYEKPDSSAYGTVNTAATSGGAVGDKICIAGRDSTHYQTWSYGGTWAVN